MFNMMMLKNFVWVIKQRTHIIIKSFFIECRREKCDVEKAKTLRKNIKVPYNFESL